MTLQQAKDLMKEKGLTYQQILAIGFAFRDSGIGFTPQVKASYKGGEPEYWTNDNFKSASFKSEQEAIFIEQLAKLAPEITEDSILTIFGIILKLMGKETGWEFRPKLKNNRPF